MNEFTDPIAILERVVKATSTVYVGEPAACKIMRGKKQLTTAINRGWVTPVFKGGQQRQHRQFMLAELINTFRPLHNISL